MPHKTINKEIKDMTQEQIRIVRMIADSIVEVVKAAGKDGAPGGTIYAALMSQGCTLNQYESLMAGLVKAGRLTRKGNLYFVA